MVRSRSPVQFQLTAWSASLVQWQNGGIVNRRRQSDSDRGLMETFLNLFLITAALGGFALAFFIFISKRKAKPIACPMDVPLRRCRPERILKIFRHSGGYLGHALLCQRGDSLFRFLFLFRLSSSIVPHLPCSVPDFFLFSLFLISYFYPSF